MKSIIASILITTASTSIAAQEIVLVCEGRGSSIIRELNAQNTTNIKITKTGGKVIKAVEGDDTFTPKKLTPKDPKLAHITRQLIVEPERIILRTENNSEGKVYDTTIENTGAYIQQFRFGETRGQCTARKRAF